MTFPFQYAVLQQTQFASFEVYEPYYSAHDLHQPRSWWRHQMETFFRVTGHLCGEFTGPGEFPAQRPVTRSFDVFFDLQPNKRLSKQWWGWWFETLSCLLWRHRNVAAARPGLAASKDTANLFRNNQQLKFENKRPMIFLSKPIRQHLLNTYNIYT